MRSCVLTRHDALHPAWVAELGRGALNRCDVPDPGVLCVVFCTDCSCRWRAWLCARDARRTLKSSCCATNSQSCTDTTTDQPSPTRTPTGPTARSTSDSRADATAKRQWTTAASNHPSDTLRRTHQRIPRGRLTSHDRVSGTHTTRRRTCTAKTRSAVTRRSTPASTFSATPSGVAWPVADEASS